MAILTISRAFGSGGEEIGQAVAKDLGYEYVDRRSLFSEMKEAGKTWKKLAREFDEQHPDIWERYDWSFRGFVALSQSVILNHAVKDKVVLMGRGGNFLLKNVPFALRIRVNAPEKERAKRVIGKEDIFHQKYTTTFKHINEDTALWLIGKVDCDMKKAVRLIYGKKIDDPSQYDMVFDLGSQKMADIIGMVEKALAEREKFNTEEARNALQLRAIAAKVKAGIATNPALVIPTLEVETKGKVLVLRGVVHNAKQHRLIEEEARKLAGDVALECSLHYRGTWGA